MIMCSELLYLCDAFVETPNRKFDNTTFWFLLASIATELSDPKINVNESSDSSGSEASLDNLSRSIFDLGQQKGVSADLGTNKEDADTSSLDQNIINALEDTFIRTDLDTEANVEGEVEEDITVGMNNTKTAKLKKTLVHPSATIDVVEAGNYKMTKINLPAVRHRRSKQLARKQAVRDSIYKSLVNTDNKLPIDIILEQLSEDDTGALFAQWDTTMNQLV